MARDTEIFKTPEPQPERTSDSYFDMVEAQNREGTEEPGSENVIDYFEQYIAAMMGQDDEPEEERRDQPWMGAQPITGESWGAPAFSAPGPGIEIEDYNPTYQPGMMGGDYRPTPKYSINDPMNILNNMSSAELVALEQEFVNAGYIEEEEMLGGNRASMIGTFTSLVTSADFNRVTWDEQLQGDVNRYEQWKLDNPEEGEKSWRQLNPFVAPVYLAPDYATLAQKAKETVRGELGRDVTSAEMNLLTGFLGEASRDQWKANEYDTALASWEARARAQETESSQSAGTVQGVDALARYGEMFEDRFAGELEHRERVDTLNRKETNLFGSIDTISRMTS